jgi:hypothetical protein
MEAEDEDEMCTCTVHAEDAGAMCACVHRLTDLNESDGVGSDLRRVCGRQTSKARRIPAESRMGCERLSGTVVRVWWCGVRTNDASSIGFKSKNRRKNREKRPRQ